MSSRPGPALHLKWYRARAAGNTGWWLASKRALLRAWCDGIAGCDGGNRTVTATAAAHNSQLSHPGPLGLDSGFVRVPSFLMIWVPAQWT